MHTSGRSRASATVSQVWAFWAPPCRNTSSGVVDPQTSALEAAVVIDGHGLVSHDRRAVVRQAELLGVVGEQPELVVGDPLDRHAQRPNWRPMPPSTRRHVPVIHADASLAKKSAAPGKSSA